MSLSFHGFHVMKSNRHFSSHLIWPFSHIWHCWHSLTHETLLGLCGSIAVAVALYLSDFSPHLSGYHFVGGGHLLFLCSSFKYWSFSRLLPGLLHWWSIAAQQTISKPTGLRIEYIYIFKNKIVNILFAHHSVGQQVRAGLGKWSWPLCHSAALT